MDLDQDGDFDVLIGYYVGSGGAWETSTFNAFLNENGFLRDATSELFPRQTANSAVDNPTSFIFGFHEIDINLDGSIDLLLETKSKDSDLKNDVSHNFFISKDDKFYPYDYHTKLGYHEIANIEKVRSADLNGDGFLDLIGKQSNLDGDIVVSAINNGLIG